MRRGFARLRNVFVVGTMTAGVLVAIGTPASATTGPGYMSVSPMAVLEGSTGDTLAFTYGAGTPGLSAGTVRLAVPNGWTRPQKKRSDSPGYVSASVGTVAVHKTQIIWRNVTLCASCSATITYSDASAPASLGSSVFATRAAAGGKKVTKPLVSSPSVLVGDVPSTPTITSVTPGIGQLTVAFTSATADPSVSGYVVTCGTQSVSTPYVTPVTISGLAALTPVDCSVYAENELGDGPSATPVSGTPELATPGQPLIAAATVGNSQLTVSYAAPPTGGVPILSYTATCGSESTTVDASTLTATVTGLTNGTLYNCTLFATDGGGNGDASGWSGVPGPPTAPTITSIVPQDGQLTIVYDGVSSDDSPSSYTGTCGGQSVTVNGSTTWITIGGLSDGTSYSCTVFATNGAGEGPQSTSDSGTPEPASSAPTSSAGGQLVAISCPTSSECIAVGAGGTEQQTGLIEVSNDGGMTFSDESVPVGSQPLNSVTCTDALDCLAVGGSSVLLTTDGGTTWQSEYAPGPLSSVSCVNTENCVGVGWTSGNNGGSEIMTSDGGMTWQSAIGYGTVGYLPSLTNVACDSSTSICIGVGPDLAMSSDMGQTWQEFGVPGGISGAVSSIACLPSTTTCVMVGPNAEGIFDPNAPAIAFITTDGGETWTNIASSFPPATATIRSISCPTSSTCYASGYVGDIGASTSDGGQTWSSFNDPSNVTPSSGTDFASEDLSCGSASTCVMVGTGSSGPAAAYTTSGAATWNPTATIG
jgi:photosystem II stability/assembly factor-like uncharacterized protein